MTFPLKNHLHHLFRRRGWLLPLVTGGVFTVFMTGLFAFKPFFLQLMDLKVYDVLFQATLAGSPSEHIVIVDLDEESLARFGQWPWPRYRVALLLEKIRRHGAVSIGLDVVFAEADRTSPRILREQLHTELGVQVDFVGLPAGLEDNDAILAGILKQGPFSLGYYLTLAASEENAAADNTGTHHLHPLLMAQVSSPNALPLDRALFQARGVIGNIPVLAAAVSGSGFMNVAPDIDGVIRRAPLLMVFEGQFYPSLALAVVLKAMGTRQVIVRSTSGGTESMRLGNVTLPLDARGQLLLNYRGPGRTFAYVSARAVLDDALEPDRLNGKLVFLGASAAGLKDIRTTPLDAVYPGVEAQATVADNLLQGDFRYRPDWALGLELLLVVGMGIISTLFITFIGGLWFLIPLGLLTAGVWWAALHLMGGHGMYISPLMPLLTLTGNFSLLTFQKFWYEEKEKRKIRHTFEHYLSPDVIQRVVRNPGLLKLGGEKKHLSILFTDIRSFTSISEALTPGELVSFMNEFLTAMTDVILQHGGTLDKYMGDAIMAFFGAPQDMPDHAVRANRAALEMFERLYECRVNWCFPGFPRIEIGVGISSGDMVVGNMGSEKRFNYTVMGDQVNLASRLEGLTKMYGVKTLISEFTRAEMGEAFVCREIDRVRVKGRERPVAVYEPYKTDYFSQGAFTWIPPFEQALAAYRRQDWQEAIMRFGQVLAIKPADNPVQIYINRCQTLADQPPGPGWDGVWIMDRK